MVNLLTSDVGRVFHALRDPVRRALLEQLGRGETAISALAATQAVSLPAISRHVRILERAGLITRRKSGREHLLRLRPEGLRTAAAWIQVLSPGGAIPAPAARSLPVRLGDVYRPALSRRRMN